MLHEFIAINREEIISRCRAKVATRSVPPPSEVEIDHGVPMFLDQLIDALRLGLTSSPEIGRSAVKHGHDLLLQGFTVSQAFTITATCVNPSPISQWKRTRPSAPMTFAH